MTLAAGATKLPVYLSNYELSLQSDCYGKTREWKNVGKDVTWRDQHADPVFQFAELVAGAANTSVYDFVFDDANDENHLEERTVIENYTRFKSELQRKERELQPFAVVRVRLREFGGSIQRADEVIVSNEDEFIRAVQQFRHRRDVDVPTSRRPVPRPPSAFRLRRGCLGDTTTLRSGRR